MISSNTTSSYAGFESISFVANIQAPKFKIKIKKQDQNRNNFYAMVVKRSRAQYNSVLKGLNLFVN